MGLLDRIRDQFLDVIEYVDKSNKIIVTKFRRESGNNELKQGTRVIVRESQAAVFLKEGQLADVELHFSKDGTVALRYQDSTLEMEVKAGETWKGIWNDGFTRIETNAS